MLFLACLKGTVAELELGIMRRRLQSGTEAKAARGELRINLPVGYVYDADGKISLDPDKRVQEALRKVFQDFDRFSSVRQLSMWYRDIGSLVPVTPTRKGSKTYWRIPAYKSLYNLLTHPIYAGAYVYGRRVSETRCVDGKLLKRVRRGLSLEKCRVCLKDHHPAYISWEQLVANRSKILENRPRWNMQDNRGAIREGLALLTGLLRCARCGSRIYVNYGKTSAMYYCDGGHEGKSKRCFSFGSKLIDQRVSEELLRAVEPFAVKATIRAVELTVEESARKLQSARLEVEAAEYEAERAFEQFDRCDPKNRLVADDLESRLNAKLADVRIARQKLEEISLSNKGLNEAQRQRLLELAKDLPIVWDHVDADPKLKKRLLRCAIHEILVQPQVDRQRLEVTIHWQGGLHTRFHVKTPCSKVRKKTDPSLVDLVAQLSTQLSDAEIARILNMKELTTLTGLQWTQDRVGHFRRHQRIRAVKRERDLDHVTMREAQAYLGVGHKGLLGLVRLGSISKNQITDFAPWRISRKELDSERVQELVRILKSTGRFPKGGASQIQRDLFDDQY